MSENNQRRGKREAPGGGHFFSEWWSRHRAWVAGLDRGGRIRYRLCLALGVIALLALIVTLWLRAWIRLPDVPDPVDPAISPLGGSPQGGGPDISGSTDYEGAELPEVTKSGRKDGYYTFLLCGRDVVSGATDTMILISYDTKGQKINAISLLRDTVINTSAKGGSSKRLSVVFARNMGDRSLTERERIENGMTALKQEVSRLTGIYPDFFVLVEWEAIGNLVNAIGGVEFDVPYDMDYDDPEQDLHIHQKKGLRLLDGRDAMEVIRFRKNNSGSLKLGDAGRTKIQRDFLTAVLKKCLTPEILLKLPALVRIFTENVDTDLTVGNILAFAQLAVGMDTENSVTFASMPFYNVSYGGAALACAQEEELLKVLNDGIDPYLNDIRSSDLQLMYKRSGGGFGVTNGTLADPAMARGSSGGSSQSSSGRGNAPEMSGVMNIDPGDIFPDPEPSSPGGEETDTQAAA